MEEFWTSQISKCLNIVAPIKIRKVKQEMYCLPKEVHEAIHRKRHLQKQHQSMIQNGKTDLHLEREFKKQKYYCIKLISKAVREKIVKMSQVIVQQNRSGTVLYLYLYLLGVYV